MVRVHIQVETSTLRELLERLHHPLELMLTRVRWRCSAFWRRAVEGCA